MQIRITPAEKVQLAEKAKDAGVPVSQFVREAIFGKPDSPQDKQALEPSVDLSELEYDFQPISPEHAKRFPGDVKSPEQRIAFDKRVRELAGPMPVHIAKRQAAREIA